MTVYFHDTFTGSDGTPLTAHSPDLGTSWTAAQDGEIFGNAASVPDFGVSYDIANPAPASADYAVLGTVLYRVFATFGKAAITLRSDGAFPITCYSAGYDFLSQVWEIGKFITGTFTSLSSVSDTGFAPGDSAVLVFEASGTSLSLSKDGAPLLTATDSDISAIQHGGLGLYPYTHDLYAIDNFYVQDLSGPPPGTHVVTGRGSFSIVTPEWLEISLTGVPGIQDHGRAEPTNYFNIGIVAWGTSNGTLSAHPVSKLLELVELPTGMTYLGYWFADGVTATITERSTP